MFDESHTPQLTPTQYIPQKQEFKYGSLSHFNLHTRLHNLYRHWHEKHSNNSSKYGFFFLSLHLIWSLHYIWYMTYIKTWPSGINVRGEWEWCDNGRKMLFLFCISTVLSWTISLFVDDEYRPECAIVGFRLQSLLCVQTGQDAGNLRRHNSRLRCHQLFDVCLVCKGL